MDLIQDIFGPLASNPYLYVKSSNVVSRNTTNFPVYLLFGVFVILLSISSCVDGSIYRVKGLATKIKTNQCLIENLRASINLKWDSALDAFSKQLPSHIPADERETMLSLKSAKLIKMFNSYRSLPDSTKKIVESIASEDELMARKIRTLSEESEYLNEQIDSILLTIHSKRHLKVGKALVKSIKSKNCNYDD